MGALPNPTRNPSVQLPSRSTIRSFQRRILAYYQCCGRKLPWRQTHDPWHILISEVMLQQTQVERVLVKFNDFIKKFPDPASLDRAPLHAVLAAWSGLGYNRRALALKKCARILCARHQGRVPEEYETLLSLPGIGPSTAAAVCVFAFNKPLVFIETNIRTVYLHVFFPKDHAVSDQKLLPVVAETLYQKDPRTWYNALMDYGAYLKRQGNNPGRRSSQYTRQQPFRGSDRELRGSVLKLLLAKSPLTLTGIVKATGNDAQRVRSIVEQLVAEGFICRRGRLLALP
ncbi:MAG: A/G-specific adenine glycosylase [Desulfobacterota bacterium]|nr:A/G-specific adenine glycosylase [Thermodesulfobacteriota bacterium]